MVACKLLNELNQHGHTTIGLKPIASGSLKTEEGLRNDDALALQNAASIKLPYELVNPICLEPAIAPHLAAAEINLKLSAQLLWQECLPTLNQPADYIIIEGAGGWLVPLNHKETMADFVKLLNCPVIVVVAMRLGCLNHALLTVESIKQQGLEFGGWIANCMDPAMSYLSDNIATLKQRLSAPLLIIEQDRL
jgi:dethiobiotin synthetase